MLFCCDLHKWTREGRVGKGEEEAEGDGQRGREERKKIITVKYFHTVFAVVTSVVVVIFIIVIIKIFLLIQFFCSSLVFY